MRDRLSPALTGFGFGLALFLTACELDEVSVAQPENALVAEVYVFMGDGEDQAMAFLHWTLGSESDVDLEDARVTLTGDLGLRVELATDAPAECLQSDAVGVVEGACFLLPPIGEDPFSPGERLEVQVLLPDGRELAGGATLPGDFDLVTPRFRACGLPPDTTLEIQWTQAEGAWAYASETLLWGIREAVAPLGIEVDEDPLSLLGISVSDADTTIVFPSEFGVFSRFSLDQELSLLLQKGIPQGTSADVTVAALERNYVNWLRAGSFNPSGQVRVPSLRGDGTGVLGLALRRTLRIDGVPPGAGFPSCFTGG